MLNKMNWIFKVVVLLFILLHRSYASFLFYDNHNMHEIEDIDIYLQVTRESTAGWCQRVVFNDSVSPVVYSLKSKFVQNILRDGYYEGLSLGYPASYHPKDINRPFVPYGCWFRRSEVSGIFVNLGTNILIEGRSRIYKQTADDTNFCSKSMSLGYTSIQTALADKEAETIVCYGDCGKVPFNTTCPPDIELRKGYHAFDTCNCSDENPILNCDGNIVMDIKKPSSMPLLDKNRCIMTDINDLKSSKLYKNHELDMMLYFTKDLLSTNRSSEGGDQILSSIASSIGRTDPISRTLILNLETNMSADSNSGMFRFKDGIINASFLLHESVPVYSVTLDVHMTERKIINIDNTYIGVITNFRNANSAIHRKWLLDDARCLKKIGAYLIILVGDFDHGVVESLMEYLHTYVDLIIGVDGRTESNTTSSYLQYHVGAGHDSMYTSTDDNVEMAGRILMFERSHFQHNAEALSNHSIISNQTNHALTSYGKVYIQKMSDYKLMFNRTTVSIFPR